MRAQRYGQGGYPPRWRGLELASR